MPASLRALLTGLVDYAGLFPPAALPMRDVVANYHHYTDSAQAWVLGRLVVPTSRLEECLAERSALRGVAELQRWHVSALIADIEEDATTIARFNAAHGGELLVDACEVKASSPEEIHRIGRIAGPDSATFVELPVASDPAPLLDVVAARKLKAKIRTGGVTAEAFPTTAQVARFLAHAAARNVTLKATAGLHHPLRGSYKLTYAPAAPRGVMFGFLNVFVAGIAAQHGLAAEELGEILEERDPSVIKFTDDALEWRDRVIDAAAIADARARVALSFGSCSFIEPVDDLQHLGFL